ncbi:MAG TPA: glycosyltransferase family 4 protein [Thermoanaerobaculia bacterium]|jgi:glycosyltransferase involved in cell wall biosynthesis|nr:glycosyltransferase family 4 protein [Thermoanaerobaculia bacterium]
MKILFVGPVFPLPAHSGGQVATFETLRSLQALCEIHLLVPPPEHDREANQAAFQRLLPNVRLHFYPTRLPRGLEMYAAAARAAVTGRSYWALSWKNRELRESVERLHAHEAFDVVHCEWFQPAVSLSGLDLPLVIRTYDVHFLVMQAWADNLPATSRLRRLYWRAQARRFRSFEAETLSSSKAVVAVSADDEAVLRSCGLQNIVTIPPPRALEPLDPDHGPAIGKPLALFIGRLDMAPNRLAFFVFADEVWPRVRQEVKGRVRVVFAGGFPDDDVRRRAVECGIEIHAPLTDADATRLFREADLFLSPVTSGTGIKVKTLDAMAHGKAMIGFQGAFRGVTAEHGLHAMIADTPADFARVFEQLIDDGPQRRALGAAARGLIRTSFDPAMLAGRLVEVYAGLLESRHVAGMHNP